MSKTLVGALRVTLGLDSAEFATGAARVQSISQKMGKQLADIGAAVSVASAGVAMAIRGAINSADDMGELAQKLGVPVESLSALKYAAEKSGVSFEDLQGSLLKLSRGMADSPQKFEKLGIAVRDARGEMRPTVDVMKDIADRFKAMPDGAEKSALAMDLFGKSGAAMILALSDGGDGLQALLDRAKELGLVISQETSDSAGRFNDSLTDLGAIATGLATIIAAELAPVLEKIGAFVLDIASAFQNLSPGTREFIAWAAGLTVLLGPILLALAAMAPVLALLFSPLTLVAAAIGGIVYAFSKWDEIVAAFSQGIGNLVDNGLRWLLENLGYTKEETDAATRAFWIVMAPLTSLKDMFVNLAVAAMQLATDFKKMAENSYTWVTTKFEELVAWLEALPSRMVEIGANIIQGLADGIASKWEAVKASIRTADTSMMQTFQEDWMIQSPSKVTEAYGKHIAEGLANGIAKGRDLVGEAVSGLNTVATGAMKGIGDLGRQVGDMFATAATNVLTGVTSLREAVGQLFQQLAQLFINSAMKSLFGDIFSGMNFGVPGYASGTMSAASGLAIVGEEGPELVRMRGGEQVYDARRTDRMLNGGAGESGPMQIRNQVYLDGTLILDRLDTAEGERALGGVMRKLGY